MRFIDRTYKSLAHLSIDTVAPGQRSVQSNRLTGAWTNLLHPLSNPLPFRSDAPRFLLYRKRLIIFRSNKSFFFNYWHTDSYNIAYYFPLSRSHYTNFYSVVLTSSSSYSCFISWSLLSLFNNPICIPLAFLKTYCQRLATHLRYFPSRLTVNNRQPRRSSV